MLSAYCCGDIGEDIVTVLPNAEEINTIKKNDVVGIKNFLYFVILFLS